MTTVILLVALIVLILALAYGLWRRARILREGSGLPEGKIVYTDMERAHAPKTSLRSERWGLIGKPDYIVASGHSLIPVEVKSTRLPRSGKPYPGHILQLAAYCLLVEETYGRTPPFGYIRYGDGRTIRVPFTEDLRAELLHTLEAMRAAERAQEVKRSHSSPWRCEHCGLAYVCGSERLVA